MHLISWIKLNVIHSYQVRSSGNTEPRTANQNHTQLETRNAQPTAKIPIVQYKIVL